MYWNYDRLDSICDFHGNKTFFMQTNCYDYGRTPQFELSHLNFLDRIGDINPFFHLYRLS